VEPLFSAIDRTIEGLTFGVYVDDYPRSEPETPVGVQRIAVMEDSLYHEDIFASCSSEG